MEKRIRKVVIPVAGLGTRSLPFSKVVPKELIPVLTRPTIDFIVEEVKSAGIEQVIFVTGSGKTALEDYFDKSPYLVSTLRERGKEKLAAVVERTEKLCEVLTVRQKEPLGLGHAVLCARPVVGDEPFAVALGDEIFPAWDGSSPPFPALVSGARETGGSVIGVMEVAQEETSSYGIVDVGGQAIGPKPIAVRRTVEKPAAKEAPSRYAIVGRYVFQPEIFDELERTAPGAGGEIQLTDAMSRLAEKGKLHAALVTGKRYDTGSLFGLVKAQIDAGARHPEIGDKLRHYIKETFCK